MMTTVSVYATPAAALVAGFVCVQAARGKTVPTWLAGLGVAACLWAAFKTAPTA